jgi:ATP-binding cassette, subfamily B, multidrug efflux pump
MAIKNTHRKERTQLQLVGRLFAFIKPYQLIFYILICLTVVLGVLEPSRPYMVQLALDQYVALRDYQGLGKILCWMVGLLIAQTATQYALSYLSDWFGQHIVRDIRIKIYTHVLELNTAFHTRNSIGRLITRNITDTDRLSDALSHDLAAVLADLLQIIGIAVFMLYINWKLALFSLTIVPIMLLVTYLFKEKIKYVYRAITDTATRLNTFVQSRSSRSLTRRQLSCRDSKALPTHIARHRISLISIIRFISLHWN